MIAVGISSCLTGQVVRYDGKHKYSRLCMRELSQIFEFQAFCPEVAIGMGVPRAPIRLVEEQSEVRALGVEDVSTDVTTALKAYAQSLSNQLVNISGYIVTERSPSCGLFATKLYTPDGVHIGERAGIFAAELQSMYPDLPMEEAERLEQTHIRRDFIERVRLYAKYSSVTS